MLEVVEDRLRIYILFSFVGKVLTASCYQKGPYKKTGEEFFRRGCSDRTRGDGFRLKKGRFRLKKKNSSL